MKTSGKNEDEGEFSRAAIGKRLRLSRKILQIDSQDVFAERAGILRTTYNQYEMGKNRISPESAWALHNEFGLTFDWIYLGDPQSMDRDFKIALRAMQRLDKSGPSSDADDPST